MKTLDVCLQFSKSSGRYFLPVFALKLFYCDPEPLVLFDRPKPIDHGKQRCTGIES